MKSWEKVKLKDICTKIDSGATPRGGKDVYVERRVALIRSQNVYCTGFLENGLAYINENQVNVLDNVKVLPHDILLNITGDSIARTCQVLSDILPARVNQHVAILRPDNSI